MPTELIQMLAADTERDEGRVPHLYLCSRGHVTVAVGLKVNSLTEALTLRLSPVGAIAADYEAVRSAPVGMVASYYAHITTARMKDADIDALLAADTERFLVSIRASLPYYDELPSAAQRAVFGMAYNLGLGGFGKYVKLRAALDARNWERAAAECRRDGISAERNSQTAEWFRLAAQEVSVIAEAGGQALPGPSAGVSSHPGQGDA